MPEISRLWDICGDVALAVALQAMDDGVADWISESELRTRISDGRWQPEYPTLVCEA